MGYFIENIKFLFWKKPRISYGVTVCNEAEELERLLKILIGGIDKKDEIVILSDEGNVTDEVLGVIDKYSPRVKHISYPLNNDFASFKNNFINHVSGDYLFQIDADEYPNGNLLKFLKSVLFLYGKWFDVFCIPRVNYVEGLTGEYIKKWGWEVDESGRINYPDVQMRLFRLGRGIHWTGNVHEELTGFITEVMKLPHEENEDYCLYHPKALARQIKQNDYYDTIKSPIVCGIEK